MKILIVNRLIAIRRGGGEYFDYYVAKEFQKFGHTVEFIVGRRMKKVDFPLNEFDTSYVATPYLRDLHYSLAESKYRVLRRIASYILDFDLYLFEKKALGLLNNRQREIDIVQLCGLPRLGTWLSRKFGFKTVVIWHGIPPKYWIKWAKRCSGHMGIGATMREDKNLVGLGAMYLDNGVDTEFFLKKRAENPKEMLGLPNDALLLIFVGRLIPIKNIDFLISGFTEATRQKDNLFMLIIGDGPERNKLEKMVQNRGISKKVIFKGYVARNEIVDYYNTADIFVITSKYETFPLSVLEAMACELPVIATNVGFLPDIVTHTVNGLIVENGNIVDLKNAIIRLAESPDLRTNMGIANRKKVEGYYTWGKTARKTLDYHMKILN